MSTSSRIALAAAAFLAAASLAQAANENANETGGFRQEGAGGTVQEGVNPVFHPSMHNPGGDAAACERFFKTYDAASGSYIGEDGKRHPC